jgi:hypothetical protein
MLTATGCMISPVNGQLYNLSDKVTFNIVVPWASSVTNFYATGADGQLWVAASCLVEHANPVRTDSLGQKWYSCSTTVQFDKTVAMGGFYTLDELPPDVKKGAPAGAFFASKITSVTKEINPDTGNDPPNSYDGMGVDTNGSCFLNEVQAKANGYDIYGKCGVQDTYIFFR